MLEVRKECCTYQLKMHSHVLCAPAAGCCLAAAALLNCFPSLLKPGLTVCASLMVRVSTVLCVELRWVKAQAAGEAGCRGRLSSPGAAWEWLGLGGDRGAQWGDNHHAEKPTPSSLPAPPVTPSGFVPTFNCMNLIIGIFWM